MEVRQNWSNGMHGDTRGLEAAAAWNVNGAWKLNASASCLTIRLHLDPDSRDVSSVTAQQDEPGYQLRLQSQLHLMTALEWDAAIYRIDDRTTQNIPAYTRLDLGLSWRAFERAELGLLGKNLFVKPHYEDNGVRSGVVPTQVDPSLTARLSIQF